MVAALVIGCGAARLHTDGPRGTLRFNGEPKDAHLVIDETSLGPVSMFEKNGVKLRPGIHRILVQKDGFFPEYRLVEVAENQLVVVDVELREIP